MRSSCSSERSFKLYSWQQPILFTLSQPTLLAPLSQLKCLYAALADRTASGEAYACLTVVQIEVEVTDDDGNGDLDLLSLCQIQHLNIARKSMVC